MNTENMDLTQGSAANKLLAFAIPLLLSSMIQLLYNTVDIIFVSRFLGTDAAASVGATAMLTNLIIGFFTGLAAGVGVTAGIAVGAKDQGRLERIIHTGAVCGLIVVTLLLSVGITLAPQILTAMDTPAEILAGSVLYLRMYLLSLFAIVTYNMGTGVLKALGDSRSPLIFQLLGGIANILGNWLLIGVLGMGIKGAALTTILSQSLAALLVLRHLMKLPEAYRFRFRRLRIDPACVGAILAIGIPAAMQTVITEFSDVLIQREINLLGVNDIAAFITYARSNALIFFPIMAIGQAQSAFVSQNIGAGKTERARSGIRLSLMIGILFVGTLILLSFAFATPMYRIFTRDEAVIQTALRLMHTTYPFFLLYLGIEVYSNTMRGSGRSFAPMVIMIIDMTLVRITALKLFSIGEHTIADIIKVYPVSWIVGFLMMFLYYIFTRKKEPA